MGAKKIAGVSGTELRRIILEQSKRANVGHIGSALSIADIIVALYRGIFDVLKPSDADRDRFILSKGHAALALYAALHLKGVISEAELNGYNTDGSLLGVHPDAAHPGIDFSTGSLGMGLSFGAGAALAARLQGSKRKVVVLMSDAECNEGAVWEATAFAAHHKLANLIAIVDANGQQALGATAQVLDYSPLEARFAAFGWDVHEVNGHDVDGMQRVLGGLNTVSGRPHMLVAHTTFGKGVSFMEHQIKWHYWPMNDEEYAQAQQEVGRIS